MADSENPIIETVEDEDDEPSWKRFLNTILKPPNWKARVFVYGGIVAFAFVLALVLYGHLYLT